MSTDLMIVLGLLAATVAMFAVNRPRMDAVALIMLTILPFTGIITMDEALAGFSDSNIVLIAALFVIGEGLVRTGVAQRIGDLLIAKAGGSTDRLVVLLMLAVGGLGAAMSSTGVVAIFIPVALRIARSAGMAVSQLMMPLSVAALTSGMLTLVATAPNLIVNSELVRQRPEEPGFHFFSFTPFGVPMLLLAILYMLYARRWLPGREAAQPSAGRAPTFADWIKQYELSGRNFRLRVTPQSPLVGQTLGGLERRDTSGLDVLAVERGRRSGGDRWDLKDLRDLIRPGVRTELEAGDILLVDLTAPDLELGAVARRFALEAEPLASAEFSDRSQEVGMVEAMVTPESELTGKTLVAARLRSRYGLTAIGLRHGSVAVKSGLANEPMKIGDTLLLMGPWGAIEELRSQSSNLVVIDPPGGAPAGVPVPGRAIHATLALAVMIGLMISGAMPNVQAALVACLLMGALRCIDLDSAYRAIHWKTLVLIVGILPFSIALQRTGGVELMVDGLRALTVDAGPRVVLGSLFLMTFLLGLFISNTATAILMAPVALAMANELQASPFPFAMIVALAASAAFVTPVSSPVNTMVAASANYSFGDFVRVGGPLALMVLLVSVLLVPWLLPLR
ncbi:MAG TPA: SLC13 family permease [Gammaproteobacteria bacterium]